MRRGRGGGGVGGERKERNERVGGVGSIELIYCFGSRDFLASFLSPMIFYPLSVLVKRSHSAFSHFLSLSVP